MAALAERTQPAWLNMIPHEIVAYITNNLDPVDIKSLLLSCRRFGFTLDRLLLKADIKTKTYNSLFWACSFNDPALAMACLKTGASPNVAFYHNPQHGGPFKKYFAYPNENRVFPTRFIHGQWLEREDIPCGPLILATKFDHIAVMKILLGFWDDEHATPREVADLVEEKGNEGHYESTSIPRYAWVERHSVAVTHVRSLEAAKLLLQAGTLRENTQINAPGNLSCAPLELLLLRHTYANPHSHLEERPFFTQRPKAPYKFPRLKKYEVQDVVELFLDNGAHARAEGVITLARYSSPGPILAAIGTKRLDIIDLILKHRPLEINDNSGEVFYALGFALGDDPTNFFLGDSGLCDDEFRHRVFIALLENGISPDAMITGSRRLLSVAIMRQRTLSVKALLERGADPNLTDAVNISFLVWSMAFGLSHYFGQLLKRGANVNRPSIHPRGFTPLMFATSDRVTAHKFKLLLLEGAEMGYVGQFLPNCNRVSVMQCLLQGFPEQGIDGHGLAIVVGNCMGQFKSPPVAKRSRKQSDRAYIPPTIRKDKFQFFITPSLDSTHFYTSEGRHVINWAIDNLHDNDLVWAIELLAPHYACSRRENDHENPVETFFSATRVEGFLRIGTLPRTHHTFKTMLQYGLDTMPGVNLGAVLHRLCKLPTIMLDPDANPALSQVDIAQNMRPYSPVTFCSSTRADDDLLNFSKFLSKQTFWTNAHLTLLRREYIGGIRPEYERQRTANIAKMITLLLERGVSFHDQSTEGSTAYENAVINGTIQSVDDKWRLPRLERKIRHRHGLAT